MANIFLSFYVYAIVFPLFFLILPLSAIGGFRFIIKNRHKRSIKEFLQQSLLIFLYTTLFAHAHFLLKNYITIFEQIPALYYTVFSIVAILYMFIPLLPLFIIAKRANWQFKKIKKQHIITAYFIFSLIYILFLAQALPTKIVNGISWQDIPYLPNLINISQIFDILQL